MKKYPTKSFELSDGSKIKVPTELAIKNFSKYLTKKEILQCEALRDIDRLRIAISVNPFNTFLELVKERR